MTTDQASSASPALAASGPALIVSNMDVTYRVRVPSLGLDVDVRPVLADQELTAAAHYWEGAVDVTGANGRVGMDGRGYVELVGYAAQ